LLDFCVSADAATLLTFFGVLGLLKGLLAFEATFADVVSFLAVMITSFFFRRFNPP
jgi:hypothetical protein